MEAAAQGDVHAVGQRPHLPLLPLQLCKRPPRLRDVSVCGCSLLAAPRLRLLSRCLARAQGLLLVYPAYLLSHSGDFVSGNHFNPFDRKLFAAHEFSAAAVSSAAVRPTGARPAM